MSRRLILLRHAKSDWDVPDLADHDRVLNKRGRADCQTIGAWLAGKGYHPDQILCSSAARTVETWTRLRTEMPDCPDAQLSEQLYLADPDTLLSALRKANGQCVALIAHNPGIGTLAADLIQHRPARAVFGRYPTLAALVVDFPIDDWSALHKGSGTCVEFIVPSDLADDAPNGRGSD